jgi:hypothetical protein
MSTLPLFSSSAFNWIGFTGFSSVKNLAILPSDTQGFVTELLVKSEKTSAVIAFKFSHRVWSYTGAAASFVYDGWTTDKNQITLIISNDLGNS